MGFLCALSPLFGRAGLVRVTPFPVGLENVGPPFVTCVSLAAGIMVAVAALRGETKRWGRLWATVILLIGVLLIAIYLSWVIGKKTWRQRSGY